MNIWKERKKLKAVVQQLRQAQLLSSYKTVLPTHRWQLIASQIILYFESSIKVKNLATSEKLIVSQSPLTLFQKTISSIKFSNPAFNQVNWTALEDFLRYSFFWENFRQTNQPNILFTETNHIQQNHKKREAFNSWWTSLALVDNSFNTCALFVLNLIGYYSW